uniref:Uncharacterized protein n=1 Tax=Picea glauca TaxID=3330 RepID=A0A101M3T9_PICGL|nr:hypothetical protein ABT39_MTgene287 [Picea glauca]
MIAYSQYSMPGLFPATQCWYLMAVDPRWKYNRCPYSISSLNALDPRGEPLNFGTQ